MHEPLRKFFADRGPHLAAMIAYFALLSLVPLIFGIAFVFFNGRSIIGWLLIAVSIIVIAAGILMNLQIYFQPTSLFNTIIMLVLFAGGIGLIAKAVISHE